MTISILKAALAYTAQGYTVFPCDPSSKKPLTVHGFKDASTDVNQISQWWTKWPSALIGVCMGRESGLLCVDVDIDQARGINGFPVFQKLLTDNEAEAPKTWCETTPRGGGHFFFKYPANLPVGTKFRSSLGPGIDVKTDGGYVIVAPSVRSDGKPYQNINGPEHLAEAPTWLLSLALKPAAPEKREAPQAVIHGEPPNIEINNDRERRYVENIVAQELSSVKNAPESTRNTILNKAAFTLYQLVPNGYLEDAAVKSELLAAVVERKNGLSVDEAERTIESARTAGLAKPRTINLPDCPPGSDLRPDGIFWRKPGEGEKTEWKKIGGPLEILGNVRNTSNLSWGLRVQWRDLEGKPHATTITRAELVGEGKPWLERLADGGWPSYPTAPSEKAQLAEFFSKVNPTRYLRSVEVTGWHSDEFVLPDRVLNGSANADKDPDICLSTSSPAGHIYGTGGSLDDWKATIGKWSAGNSRLQLAICSALAAPLLDLAGFESGGFNFVGGSSTGKTTALFVAANVWGKGSAEGGAVHTWRATSNGLEGLAAMHNDSLFCLDELGQAPVRAISEAAYMLSNGQGKSRANRYGEARQTKAWRTLVLSTGELGLAEKIRADGGRAQAGQEVRLLDIPADAEAELGLFENLHGFGSPREFADALREAASRDYGHLAPAFINEIIDNRKVDSRKFSDTVTKSLTQARAILLSGIVAPDGQVERAAGRFALCLVAGALAINFGLLPWTGGDLKSGIKKCFDSWLDNRGTTGDLESRRIINQVRHFLEAHGDARFQPVNPEPMHTGRVWANRAGFRDTIEGADIYYVYSAVFEQEVCCGHNPKAACKVLLTAGILRRTEDGRNKSRLPEKVDNSRTRCYLLSLSEEQTE